MICNNCRNKDICRYVEETYRLEHAINDIKLNTNIHTLSVGCRMFSPPTTFNKLLPNISDLNSYVSTINTGTVNYHVDSADCASDD